MAVDPEVIAAVEKTAVLLSELGHHVEQAEPPIDQPQLARDFLAIWYAQLSHLLQETRVLFGTVAADFELDSLAMEAVALGRSARDYADSYVRWTEYGYQLGTFLQDYDVYMTPTLAQAAPRIGALATPPMAAAVGRALMPLGLSRLIALGSRIIEDIALQNLAVTPFTQLANVTGVPAMSVPLHSFGSGLPLGIQFLGGHGSEGLLFSLAGQLERTSPWVGRVAPMS
jgi:amidase